MPRSVTHHSGSSVTYLAGSNLIFNHGWIFAGGSKHSLPQAALANNSIGQLPAPDILAQRVSDAVNARADSGGPWKLSSDEPPHFASELIAQTTSEAKHRSVVLVDLNRREGSVTFFPENPDDRRPPSEVKKMKGLGKPIVDAAVKEKILADALAVGQPGQKMGPNSRLLVPQLVFSATAQGKVWWLAYDLENDRLDAKPSKSPAMPWWSFLLRLHVSGGYPQSLQTLYFWAIVADGMAFLMCLWALTGIAMWFQMKYLRSWGVAVIVLAALATWLLGSAMYHRFTGGW